MADKRVYTVGGAVPSDRIYIPRRADEILYDLCRSGEFAYILTARQLGKSSLRRRIAQRLDADAIVSIDIDLTAIGTPEEAAPWYLGVLTTVEDILFEKGIYLQTDVTTFWQTHADLGPTQRFARFFQQVLLTEVAAQIVIFIDEIDTTLKMAYTDDFFAAIRYFYEVRTSHPEFKRLSFVLIGVATPTDLIHDPKRTPFNIGQRVELTDFTYQETLPLAAGLNANAAHAEQVLAWVFAWTNGHPYLTQRLCSQLAGQAKAQFAKDDVEQAVRTGFLAEGSHGDDNLKWVGDFLVRGAPEGQVTQVLATYRDVYRGRIPVADNAQSPVVTHLKLSGVVSVAENTLRLRNRIYREVFDQAWIKDHWPVSWWASIPKGIKFASGVIALLFVALFFVSVFALRQQQQMQTTVASLRSEIAARRTAESQILEQEQLAVQRAAEAKQERDRANIQARLATARQLVTSALTNLATDPELSAWLAIAAVRTNKTLEAETTLRQAIQALRIEQTWPFSATQAAIADIDISPDGTYLAAGGEEGEIKLWQLTDATHFAPLHTLFVRQPPAVAVAVAFSPNGQYIAVTAFNEIELWQVTDGTLLLRLQGDGEEGADKPRLFTAVAFSPDNRYVAALNLVGMLKIWEVASGQLISRWRVHENYGTSLAFSPDGTLLATASKNEAVKLWDVTTLTNLRAVAKLDGHSFGVDDLAFSPDGNLLATAGRDTVAILWDIGENQQVQQRQRLLGHAALISKLAFSPNGHCLATASLDKTVRLWDLSSMTAPLVLSGHSDWVSGVVFEPTMQTEQISFLTTCGAKLITSSIDGMLRLWHTGASRELLTFTGHQNAVRTVAFSANGQYLASASDDHTAMIWQVASGQPVQLLAGHSDRVTDLVFSADQRSLITASRDQTLKVWDVNTGRERYTLHNHNAAVLRLALHPSGDLLASVDEAGKTLLWQLGATPPEPITLATPERCNNAERSVAFSPDGKRLAATCLRDTVIVWDVALQQQIAMPHPENMAIHDIAFSPAGDELVMVGIDGLIVFWDLAASQEVDRLQGHVNQLFSIRFSPNGRWFVTGGDDGLANVYDAATKEKLHLLPGNPLVINDAVFSPDNTLVATAGEDGTIRLYVLAIEPLITLAQSRMIQPLSREKCEQYQLAEPCSDQRLLPLNSY